LNNLSRQQLKRGQNASMRSVASGLLISPSLYYSITIENTTYNTKSALSRWPLRFCWRMKRVVCNTVNTRTQLYLTLHYLLHNHTNVPSEKRIKLKYFNIGTLVFIYPKWKKHTANFNRPKGYLYKMNETLLTESSISTTNIVGIAASACLATKLTRGHGPTSQHDLLDTKHTV
jgi:hypothetical protein